MSRTLKKNFKTCISVVKKMMKKIYIWRTYVYVKERFVSYWYVTQNGKKTSINNKFLNKSTNCNHFCNKHTKNWCFSNLINAFAMRTTFSQLLWPKCLFSLQSQAHVPVSPSSVNPLQQLLLPLQPQQHCCSPRKFTSISHYDFQYLERGYPKKQ